MALSIVTAVFLFSSVQPSEALTVTSLSPTTGVAAGGTVVTITGQFPGLPIAPVTTMQQMNQTYCASMPVYPANGSTITLVDTRNNQSYQIRKLQDNNCWMVNNLKIVLSDVAANPSDSHPSINATALAAQTSPDNSGSASYNQPRYYDPTCGMPNAPSICGNTDTTSSTFYGYLYNWCAAMGGTSASCTDSSTYPTDLASNAADGGNYDPLNTASICPVNWRLPTGDATGEFAWLNAKMNDPNATNPSTSSSLYTNWLYSGAFQGVFSSNWSSGFSNQGSRAYLWSSSAYPGYPGSVHFAYFTSSSVNPTNGNTRNSGYAVRCLAVGGDNAPTVTFGGEPATVISHSDTEIIVSVPAHAAGAVDVVVDNGDGSPMTLTAGYTYRDPMTISSLSPNHGLELGGETVTITGKNIIPPAPTTMQQMTQDYCKSMPVYPANGSTLTLTDTRNNQPYQIRKLQDNNCWMVNNLRISLSDVAANPNASDTKLDSTALTALAAQSSPDNSGSYSYNQPRYYDPTCGASNAPTNCGYTDITSSTFYGYFYNWCAAMGATTASCTASDTYPTDLASNAADGDNYDPLNTASICPANWRMPTGGSTGELAVLNGSMYNNAPSSADTTNNAAYATNWLYSGPFQGVFSGYWGSGFSNQGSDTRLWSSSVVPGYSGSAYFAHTTSSSVNSANGNTRNSGFAVRCLAVGGDNAPTVTFGDEEATDVSVAVNGDGTQTITATTPPHTAGLVDVVVDNGVDKVTLPAEWIDPSQPETPANVQSGYLYEAIYLSLVIDSSPSLSGSPNLLMTDSVVAKVKTNNPTGYEATIQSAQPNLKCTASNNYISAVSGTSSNLLNTWGYGVGSAQPTSWTGLTTTPATIKTFSTATDQTFGDNTTLHFGAKVDFSLPACKYRGTATITAVGN